VHLNGCLQNGMTWNKYTYTSLGIDASLDLTWLVLPLAFGIGVIAPSSKCCPFNSEVFDLAWELFGKFAVLFLNGVVPSGVLANLASEWGKSQQRSWIHVSSELGVTHQRSCELRTLKGKNSYNRVGPSSGENPSSGV